MIITEDKNRRMTADSQRKRDIITVSSETVPPILEECISILRCQQRRLHREVISIDTMVCPLSLQTATTLEDSRPRQFETRTLINIIIGMRKNNTQIMFIPARRSGLNVKRKVGKCVQQDVLTTAEHTSTQRR
jgi:hypothetical protein